MEDRALHAQRQEEEPDEPAVPTPTGETGREALSPHRRSGLSGATEVPRASIAKGVPLSSSHPFRVRQYDPSVPSSIAATGAPGVLRAVSLGCPCLAKRQLVEALPEGRALTAMPKLSHPLAEPQALRFHMFDATLPRTSSTGSVPTQRYAQGTGSARVERLASPQGIGPSLRPRRLRAAVPSWQAVTPGVLPAVSQGEAPPRARIQPVQPTYARSFGDVAWEADWEEEEFGPPGGRGSSGLLECFWEARPGMATIRRLLSGGRSRLVLVDEDTVDDGLGLLLYLLHEAYRCQHGDVLVQWVGPAEPTPRLAGGRISQLEAGLDSGLLRSRVQELFGGRPSVVVMQETAASFVDDLLRTPGFDVIRLRRHRPDRGFEGWALRWTFGNLVPERPPIDPAARELEALFTGKLRSYQWRVDPRHRRRSLAAPEAESSEHYWIKMYVAWLHRKQRVDVERPEHGASGRERVPDVWVEEGPVYYEVETFYGTGDPVAKLNGTLDKYGEAEEVRVVIPNVQAMLFLPDLLRAERVIQRQRRAVSFWTIDLSRTRADGEQGLVPLRELASTWPREGARG